MGASVRVVVLEFVLVKEVADCSDTFDDVGPRGVARGTNFVILEASKIISFLIAMFSRISCTSRAQYASLAASVITIHQSRSRLSIQMILTMLLFLTEDELPIAHSLGTFPERLLRILLNDLSQTHQSTFVGELRVGMSSQVGQINESRAMDVEISKEFLPVI